MSENVDLSFLREREEKILCALLGLQSQNGFGDGLRRSRKTVAGDLGITVEQVGQIKERAMKKVLHANAKLYPILMQVEEVETDEVDLLAVAEGDENDMLGPILDACLMTNHISDVLLTLAVACTFQATEATKEEAEELTAVGADLMKIIAARFPDEAELIVAVAEAPAAESEAGEGEEAGEALTG